MIAKKFRLREYEVSRVFKKWRPFFWTYWTMNCLVDPRGKNHRMAVTISRKHDKRAVARNRYRRGIYDWLLPSLKFSVLSLKQDTIGAPTENSKLKTQNFLCIFTLKKWLKLTEKKIPETWVDDARKLFEKRK